MYSRLLTHLGLVVHFFVNERKRLWQRQKNPGLGNGEGGLHTFGGRDGLRRKKKNFTENSLLLLSLGTRNGVELKEGSKLQGRTTKTGGVTGVGTVVRG